MNISNENYLISNINRIKDSSQIMKKIPTSKNFRLLWIKAIVL